jgi:hypothetical protein
MCCNQFLVFLYVVQNWSYIKFSWQSLCCVYSVPVCPAVFLVYTISAAVILFASRCNGLISTTV